VAVTGSSFAGVDPRREALGYHPLIQVVLMGVAGAFLSGDIFNLYVWFEVMLIGSFVLMSLHRTRAQLHAAFTYVSLNLLASAFLLTAIGLLCVAIAPAIVRFFVPEDPAVIKEGAAFIRIVSWSFGFVGLQFALMGVLRAAGEMIPAMVISLVSQWVLQIPLAYVLSKHTSLGASGVWWSTPIANIVTAIIAGLWFARGNWKTRRLIAQPGAPASQENVEELAQMEP